MDQRIRITKAMLQKALIEMVAEQDINRISIRELCQRANINRTTFYKYYGSQYDLLKEIQIEFIEQIKEKFKSIDCEHDFFSSIKNALYILNNDIERARFFFVNNRDVNFFILLGNEITFKGSFMNQLGDIPENYKEYIFNMLATGMHRVTYEWLKKDERESPESIARMFTRLSSLVVNYKE